MYPIAKVLCPLLYPLGITPNQITLFNVLVSLANAWTICKCIANSDSTSHIVLRNKPTETFCASSHVPSRITNTVLTPGRISVDHESWLLAWMLNFIHQVDQCAQSVIS